MFNTLFNLIFYFFIAVEIIINMQVNGIWKLPGQWSKDDTVSYGLIACVLLAILFTYYFSMSTGAVIILLGLYVLTIKHLNKGYDLILLA